MDIFKRVNELDEIKPHEINDEYYFITDKVGLESAQKVNAVNLINELALERPPLENNAPQKFWARKNGKWVEIAVREDGSLGVSQEYVDKQDKYYLQVVEEKIQQATLMDTEMSDFSSKGVQNKVIKKYVDNLYPDGDKQLYGADNLKY